MTISANTRQRVVVLLTSIALAVTLLLAGAVVARADDAAASPTAAADVPTVSHVVQSGDTLWGIATVHTPAGEDVRVLIEDIKRLNGLTSSVIVPGQALLVPVSR